MVLAEYYNRLTTHRNKLEPKINTLANHLMVIYAFALPALIEVRRSSFFLLLVLFIIRGNYYYYFKNALRDSLILAFALYFLVHVIWLIGYDGSPFTKQIVHDSAFMLYPLLFFTFIDQRYRKRILYAFIMGMVFSELLSYSLSFRWINQSTFKWINGTYLDPAPIFNHTQYGFMLAIYIFNIFIILRLERLNRYMFILLSAMLVSSTINIFFAGGRTGPVLLFALVISYVIFHLKQRRAQYITVVTFLLITVFTSAYFFSDSFHIRVNRTIDSIKLIKNQDNFETSTGYRVAIILNSVEILKHHWLFGVGTGNQLPEIRKIVNKNIPDLQKKLGPINNMQSEFLGSLTQFGVIGLLAFIYIIYRIFTYRSEYFLTKELFPLLSIAIILYSFIDIFTIGLGALLISVFIVSIGLNNFVTHNASFKKIEAKQLIYYALGTVLLSVL